MLKQINGIICASTCVQFKTTQSRKPRIYGLFLFDNYTSYVV